VRAKNEVHAVAMRCLLGRPPVSDLVGVAGREWLNAHVPPDPEASYGFQLPAPDQLPAV
jgi:hypothetical protein